MTNAARVALVVHGHFYQPPRENPWTDEVAREDSAQPFHDWNERINAESYRANAFVRMVSAGQRIRALVNNYERMSFNFGPTLARWIERHDPLTDALIRRGDGEQQRRLGAGGALAQIWGHPIAPLLSPNDRRTQIHWGLSDFARRFARPAAGMWLAETAVDPPTLEALIDAGIAFTVVAPEQVAAVRAPGQGWSPVNRDTLDTGRAYRWMHSDLSGRFITLAVFDGPLSRDLAFGVATRDAASYLAGVKAAGDRSNVDGKRLVLAASDGELYGHHKKFADLTLAYATTVEAAAQGVEVTNLAAFLRDTPATWEAELARGPNGEGTAWSCQHGFGRWRRHCGCVINPAAYPSQAWRGPLRDALDGLRDAAAILFEDQAADLFEDPWGARDAYGEVIDAPTAVRLDFLRAMGRPRLAKGDAQALRRAHLVMELQRASLLMYASCGWFFDDVAGIESALVIRQAAHVLDLWRQLGAAPPTEIVLETLAQARSNVPALGTGADVFLRVSRERVTAARAVAQVAFAALAPGIAPTRGCPGFKVDLAPTRTSTTATHGQATVTHGRTGEITQGAYVATYDGQTRFLLRINGDRVTLADLRTEAAEPIALAALAHLAGAPVSAQNCRSALALAHHRAADVPGPLPAAWQDRLGDMLLALLGALLPDNTSAETLALAGDLILHAGLPAKTAVGLRVEELLWEQLAPYLRRHESPPPGLRSLAERVGFTFGG